MPAVRKKVMKREEENCAEKGVKVCKRFGLRDLLEFCGGVALFARFFNTSVDRKETC